MSSQQKDIESSDEEHDFIVEKKTKVEDSTKETVEDSTKETVEDSTKETVSTEEQNQKHVMKNATVLNTVESDDSSDSEYEEIIIRKKVKKKCKKNRKRKEKKLVKDDNSVQLREFVNQLENVNMFDFQIEPMGQ